MRTRLFTDLLCVASLALPGLLSCGPAASAPGLLSPDQAALVVTPDVHVPWVKMNHGQRIDYMVKAVLPKMKTEFVAFDAKRFARMNCATCHGDAVDDGSFSMPNPKLPKLLESDGFAKHLKLTPDMTHFMFTKVEPDMAALLEVPEFDPATRKGLSCYNCHPREIDPDKPVPPPAEHH